MESQEVSLVVLREKYAKGNEKTWADIFRRVARALASVEAHPDTWEPVFYDALLAGFIPAGRIMSAAGTDIEATLINCFVQPVGDSVSETKGGKPGIYVALKEAAETMRRGGGVGYDFSRIRPRGALVKGTASRASGPVSYMRVFDRSCETVESAGARRGAQMGVLRCDHPDVFEFVNAKNAKGELTNFNISVAVTDAFMRAVEVDEMWELVHPAEPDRAAEATATAYRRKDGMWVYRTIKAQDLWTTIMRNTYDHAEPGVLFVDRMNGENNLHYCEVIEATNPCAEQPLPDYGCCCLGSIDLTKFVDDPFGARPQFDEERFSKVVSTAIRMLDNVLDVTYWPLPQQREEAMSKRRIGLGFTGLGDALIMLGLRYDSDTARHKASRISEVMCEASYRASIELAREKGPFPLFKPAYLDSGFAKRLSPNVRKGIEQHGLRNSHLLSIAPTGTISLAFADNASNGIEPPYSWVYTRKKRTADGGHAEFLVQDHAFRLYRQSRPDLKLTDDQLAKMSLPDLRKCLPDYFVSALEITAKDHQAMVAAVAPFIDTSISKTVNVPADYPFEDFKDLYLEAWRSRVKGLSTFRPNDVTGSVLSVEPTTSLPKEDLDESDPDRRIRLKEVPTPPMASLRWRKRPSLPAGNPAWCYMVNHPQGYKFAVFIGHIENGSNHPFEVWVNGVEQPRGLGALAKSLSMDMRSNDRGWLKTKLESLMRAKGDDAFPMPLPPEGEPVWVPSLVSGFARLLMHRCEALQAFTPEGETPLLNALMSPKEPKTGPDGTMSWTVDVLNPATGDDFVFGVKELVLPTGARRPYSVWLSGVYPRVLDGLCKSLSYDMRVIDPAWIGGKLRQLRDFSEARGDFLARVPGSVKQQNYPSTVAYLAALLKHRYTMLDILDEEGYPLETMGLVETVDAENVVRFKARSAGAMEVRPGKCCGECGIYAVIKRDGCDFCTACGATGACG